MAQFQDLFSAHAACYAQARPGYPPALFAWLAGLTRDHDLAWDCATGNGQAAIGLAEHFERVIATDASQAQLDHATPQPRVAYRRASAESSGLAEASVDLVTVAQALHWLPLDAFYAEVRRVLKPGGIFAAWCYGIHHVEPAIDAVTGRLYRDITGPYWPAGRRYIDEHYATIPFPFDEMRPTPAFECRETWTFAQYIDYLHSWSATQKYIEKNAADPVDLVRAELTRAWGDAQGPRDVRWPIHMRVARIP